MLTVTILRRELNNNEQFRAWFQKHKVFCIFIAFCSLGNTNVLHVLNCKFNYMDIFNAKLSSTVEKKIIHASVISLLFGDLPRLGAMVSVHMEFLYKIIHTEYIYIFDIIKKRCIFTIGLL
jgi:hypothetical protein